MNLFDVYPLFDVNLVRGEGVWVWDDRGEKYLDLYGGHAVISIGHSHPHYVERLHAQLRKISFYSNSVHNELQEALAEKLGTVSGYPDYQLFLCNSGAEANENALKLASFITGRKKVIAFRNAFHGRTSGAVAATDNPRIISPFNASHDVEFLPLNDESAISGALDDNVAAVIIEGIQGVAGIRMPDDAFLQFLQRRCDANGSMLILDEIQSGYGRTGQFFAHQHAGIRPHLITTAKGMANGFPIGGVLIHPDIRGWHGMLGTTFGGNYLASAAGMAVLEVIEQEQLIANARTIGNYWLHALKDLPHTTGVRGRGLMIGIDLEESKKSVRNNLLFKHHIFTGEARPNTIRLLPSLTIASGEADLFIEALKQELS